VTFRAADFADVFCEDGCIEMSEFAEEDAVAFAITPAEAGVRAVRPRRMIIMTGAFSRKDFP